jgi:hypothetical protein
LVITGDVGHEVGHAPRRILAVDRVRGDPVGGNPQLLPVVGEGDGEAGGVDVGVEVVVLVAGVVFLGQIPLDLLLVEGNREAHRRLRVRQHVLEIGRRRPTRQRLLGRDTHDGGALELEKLGRELGERLRIVHGQHDLPLLAARALGRDRQILHHVQNLASRRIRPAPAQFWPPP